MLDFIIKYWIECLFGLMIAGAGAAFKWAWQMKRKEQAQGREAFKQTMVEAFREELSTHSTMAEKADAELWNQIKTISDNVDNLTAGVLSMQKKDFMKECETLLESGHVITVQEYEELESDHIAYNRLKGNHEGDAMYARVVEKFNAQVSK